MEAVIENQIRKYRKKRGMSQRQLAEAAKTSQQQIQRFEGGAPVKLNLAAAIAEALHAPLATVFPGSKKPLEMIVEKGDVGEALTNPDIENALLSAGIEADPSVWTVKVLVRGHETKFYRIGVAEKNRAFDLLANRSTCDEDCNRFMVFESEAKTVAINLNHVVFWQNLFDPAGSMSTPDEQDSDEGCMVTFYMANQKEPLEFSVEPDEPEPTNLEEELDEGVFRSLLTDCDMGIDQNAFVTFMDEDGEYAFLKASDIAILEVSKPVTHYEFYEDESDEDEEDNQLDEATAGGEEVQ